MSTPITPRTPRTDGAAFLDIEFPSSYFQQRPPEEAVDPCLLIADSAT